MDPRFDAIAVLSLLIMLAYLVPFAFSSVRAANLGVDETRASFLIFILGKWCCILLAELLQKIFRISLNVSLSNILLLLYYYYILHVYPCLPGCLVLLWMWNFMRRHYSDMNVIIPVIFGTVLMRARVCTVQCNITYFWWQLYILFAVYYRREHNVWTAARFRYSPDSSGESSLCTQCILNVSGCGLCISTVMHNLPSYGCCSVLLRVLHGWVD